MHVSNDRIDAVAREIRKYYIERKSALFNGQFKIHKKFAEFRHWQEAALVCIELGATPETYVDAAFAHCGIPAGPYPNNMAGGAIRGWYGRYAHKPARTVQPTVGTNSADFLAGLTAGVNKSLPPSPAMITLKEDIDWTRRSLLRLTGTCNINATTIEYINSFTVSYPPHVRALLGYGNEKVKKFFGSEALDIFIKNPAIYRAAEDLGYPIRDILLWLSARTN